MFRAGLIGCATALLLGCHPPRGPHDVSPATRDDRAHREKIAKLEAARGGGLAELAALARDGDAPTAALALRGLGRVNTIEAARALFVDAVGPDAVASATAIGIASALDEPTQDQRTRRTDALLAAYRADVEHRPAILEALGRAGDARALPALASALALTPDVGAAAGLALGRFGRRKLALDEPTRAALITASRSPDAAVRYAATYALRYDLATPAELAKLAGHDPVAAALAARVADSEPETRAVALTGLAKREEIDAARPAVEAALTDADWRVAVEAVRALGGEHGGAAGDAAVAAAVPRWLAMMAQDPRAEHVVMEALRGLDHAAAPPPVVTAMLRAIVPPPSAPPIVRGWITCLALAARARHGDASLADVASCGAGELPDHLRLPLVADLIENHAGDPATRRTAFGALLAHPDVRVRGAALGVLHAIWPDGTDADHAAAIALLASAIASPDAAIVGAAIDEVPKLPDTVAKEDVAQLDAAIIARATREADPELAASVLELIGTRKLAAGAAACRQALTGHPVRAKAGAACLRALGEPVLSEAARPAPIEPPPVDLAAVIGKTVRWHLVTTRGEIVIALRPDVAPWAVATIVALTQKGFYDKLEMHRVVPDFVAQGGDPTETGAGGPGFTIPAEPASMVDGPGFTAGGVGMADAGPDSAGSQWFIMHSRAPHLDGRYTWVGTVESGQKSADSLVIGDAVVHATVEITSKP